jgi:signal transduction histidine kinase
MGAPARRRSQPGRDARLSSATSIGAGFGAQGQALVSAPLALLALTSFALFALLSLQPSAGDAAGAAVAATLPSRTYEWPFVAHVTSFAFSGVLFLLQRSRSATASRHAATLCFISAVSTIAAGLHALPGRPAPARMSAYGTVVSPLRMVAWIHSTPAMLLLIGELAGATPGGIGVAIALDEGMLVTGLLAQVVPAPAAHVFAALSFALLAPLLWSMHVMLAAAGARSAPGSTRARAVSACRAASMCLWSVFPAVFAASALGMLSHSATAAAWAFADVGAKACFAFTLLHANSLTLDEAAVAASRAAAEAKSRQLAQLCHEIRNPLNGIMGNLAELDVETAATSVGVAALVTTTLTCASQLRRTLDDFLDLARSDHSALRLVRAPARLRPLLGDVARQVLRAAHDKGLSVRVHVPRELAARVFLLDAGRVAQVLSKYVPCAFG